MSEANIARPDQPLLRVDDLHISVPASGARVVKGVSLSIRPGEMVGIVGESGSGKTLVSRAIMGLLPPSVSRDSGRILFRGQDIAAMPPRALRRLRGPGIGMVFQEPMTSLNPTLTIGRQLSEGLELHQRLSRADLRRRILDMLDRIGIPGGENALRAYPHQFSGGMRQRIMIAAVMLLKPALVLADEPTTALDAVIQRDVMEMLVELSQENGTAVLLVSHDLPMVARYTSRTIVMRHGEQVEESPTDRLLAAPREAYTRELLAALPRRLPRAEVDRSGVPLLEVRDLVVDYAGRRRILRTPATRALHGVDVKVHRNEIVALVGGSGSGKTSLGRTVAGLIRPTAGEILFRGRSILTDAGIHADYRRNTQMIFQDPFTSLDPRMSVRALVGEALRTFADIPAREKADRVRQTLHDVGLDDSYLDRLPHQMSGGQRQRVAIARAIVRRPALVIADEAVSALDVTVRSRILDLFAGLQSTYGFSSLFISHDLGVVEQVADRIVVMQQGRVIEAGSREQVLDAPRMPYTRKLLSAIPQLRRRDDGGVELEWR